jgi:hypothetical protein
MSATPCDRTHFLQALLHSIKARAYRWIEIGCDFLATPKPIRDLLELNPRVPNRVRGDTRNSTEVKITPTGLIFQSDPSENPAKSQFVK